MGFYTTYQPHYLHHKHNSLKILNLNHIIRYNQLNYHKFMHMFYNTVQNIWNNKHKVLLYMDLHIPYHLFHHILQHPSYHMCYQVCTNRHILLILNQLMLRFSYKVYLIRNNNGKQYFCILFRSINNHILPLI